MYVSSTSVQKWSPELLILKPKQVTRKGFWTMQLESDLFKMYSPLFACLFIFVVEQRFQVDFKVVQK